MGKYINKGNEGFKSVCNSNFVDKSMLIERVNSVLNTENRFMCVTRARRFGKSVAVKMLNAYYDQSCDSSALFEPLRVCACPDYDVHLNRYPVVYIDMTDFMTKYKGDEQLVRKMSRELSEDLLTAFPDVVMKEGDDLMDLFISIVGKSGQQFICLIDEWDALCREGGAKQVDEYIDLLRRLFKGSNTDAVFAGVYITGILPIKKYNTQSALNNFEEYTMMSPAELAPYFGFTEQETIGLCERAGMSLRDMKYWYDGYRIGSEATIYNPYAVMRALKRRHYENYWTGTNTFESLQRYISMNFDGLKDDVAGLLADVPVKINSLSFGNDMHSVSSKDDVLTLLCHLGYLSYDWEQKTARIPNYEVRQEFETAISGTGWESVANALASSENLLQAVLDGECEDVARMVEKVHQENTSVLKYNDENSLACVLSLGFYTARSRYKMLREMPSGKGFADVVLIPLRGVELPAIVLELKYNQSADTAIRQIKKLDYGTWLQQYSGDILLVGINYDKKSKEHTCVIEKVVKPAAEHYPLETS